jgi:hypothetical protein
MAGRARSGEALSLGDRAARFGLRVFLHFGTGRAADSLTLRWPLVSILPLPRIISSLCARPF